MLNKNETKREVARRLLIVKQQKTTIDWDILTQSLASEGYEPLYIEEALESLHREGVFIYTVQKQIKVL